MSVKVGDIAPNVIGQIAGVVLTWTADAVLVSFVSVYLLTQSVAEPEA
jgi:23S rRNA maturation mini-RNase III